MQQALPFKKSYAGGLGLPEATKYRFDRLVDGELRGVEQKGVRLLAQRRYRPGRIARVPIDNVLQNPWEVSRFPLADQLLMAARCTLIGAGSQKNLCRSLRKHHRPHVAAIGHQARNHGKITLSLQ